MYKQITDENLLHSTAGKKVQSVCRTYIEKVKVFIAHSHLTLCDPVDYSPPGSSVHGILQARIL